MDSPAGVAHEGADTGSTPHDRGQRRRRLTALALVALAGIAALAQLRGSTWAGSADLHAATELACATLALLSGVAFLGYFIALRDHLYLLIGLAFLVNGVEDLIHGLIAFRNAFHLTDASLTAYVPATYVTGRLLLGALLIAAPFASSFFKPSVDPGRELRRVGIPLVALTALLTIVATLLPLPRMVYPAQLISRPVDLVAALVLVAALGAFLREYLNTGRMLLWWMALSILLGALGQIAMGFSVALDDPLFNAAHLLKGMGYAIPLLGAAVYRTMVLSENATLQADLLRQRAHLEKIADQRATDLHERLKELRCLFAVSNSLSTRRSLSEVFEDTVHALVAGFQYPEITRARLQYGEVEVTSHRFEDTPWRLASGIVVDGVERGRIEVFYTEERPEAGVGPFLGEERDLVDRIAEILGREAKHKASEAELNRIFEMSLDMICIADLNTSTFTRLNPAFTSILGYPREDLEGTSFLTLIHPDDVQPTIEVVERDLKEGKKVIHFENRYRRSDGTYRWLSWVSHPDVSAGLTFAIARDVTEKRESVQMLEVMNERLHRSNLDLEQFAYVASHDLQEPLRAVSSFAQLLEKRYGGALDEKADGYIQHIVDGATRMRTMINDLLTYSRVNTKGRDPDPVDPHEALGRAIVNLASRIQSTHAVVTNEDLPPVMADATQLTQVFQNLIGNAIKFRRPDTVPAVNVTARENGCEVEFSVSDNGIGIEPQYRDRIFEVFQRLHGRGHYPGTGIGLAVCKRVVERHGGRIWVESTPGSGSTFLFTLPRATETPR